MNKAQYSASKARAQFPFYIGQLPLDSTIGLSAPLFTELMHIINICDKPHKGFLSKDVAKGAVTGGKNLAEVPNQMNYCRQVSLSQAIM